MRRAKHKRNDEKCIRKIESQRNGQAKSKENGHKRKRITIKKTQAKCTPKQWHTNLQSMAFSSMVMRGNEFQWNFSLFLFNEFFKKILLTYHESFSIVSQLHLHCRPMVDPPFQLQLYRREILHESISVCLEIEEKKN